ncbi:MAG: M48 family metallopeptidase [Enterocloster sp.]
MIKKIEIGWRQNDTEGVIPVEVVYSRRRSLGLEIKPDGSVRARVPLRSSNEQVMTFIKERQEWIVEKWFLVKERRKEEENRPLRDYEKDEKLEKHYRREAKKKLEERTAYFAEKMGVTYNRIAVKAAKTRWGSCSAQGNLNFHWKLILMPPQVLDYVVVHELAHRKEMNHSERFWAEVARILPDYKIRRKWLKENGGNV